jgi:hypothetical protein
MKNIRGVASSSYSEVPRYVAIRKVLDSSSYTSLSCLFKDAASIETI